MKAFKQERFLPVTAKLSRNFYERLGDEIAGELVDWFNAVDSTYQAQLREINDMNWERFKVELRAETSRVREELRTEMSGLREELRTEMSGLREELRTEMARLRADMMKWMFLYWTGTIAAQAAVIWAVVNR